MTRVGVISDTHGMMRPQALAALEGSDLILHAGDVGTQQIFDALRNIAQVIAVEGNIDVGRWSPRLPPFVRVDCEAVNIYMLHVIDHLDIDPAAEGIKVVIYGHSHKPLQEVRNGVLYLNPGSAGPRRFDLPVSVAILQIEGDSVQAEIITLPV